MMREAQYYSLEGLCSAVQRLQERLVVLGKYFFRREILYEMHNPLPGLWQRMDAGLLALKNFSIICAGDGCFFALAPGTVSGFCPAVGSWQQIATTAPIQD